MEEDVVTEGASDAAGKPKWSTSRRVAVALVTLMVLLGFAAGVYGFFILLGVVCLGVGLVGLLVGHQRWAGVTSRKVAGLLAAGSLIPLGAGAALAPPSINGSPHGVAVATPTTSPTGPEPPSAPVTSPSTSTGTSGATPAETTTTAADPLPPAPSDGSALAALAQLPVKGRAPLTGYTRDTFGPAWADVDRNGCDTRNDILRRDLTATTIKDGTHGCVVLTGTLADPYTAKQIAFVRGTGTSTQVQIDHVVALADAWQKGAQQLDPATREKLANDPLDLLATDGPTNQAKGAGDAATWLPPNRAYRCQYVARQVAVKVEYRLWVTQAEHDEIADILAGCPQQPLPDGT
ncbi:MAG TPA: HNH endonuclease family protein [Pedococcus sp.]|nr:HNH endonuclease family protein [Pedococcus sp.]